MAKSEEECLDLLDDLGETAMINYVDEDNNCRTYYKGSPQDIMAMSMNALVSLGEKFKYETEHPEEFDRIFYTNLIAILKNRGIELPKF